MELIILSLVGSLGAVLLHLLDFISQRPGRASCPVAAVRTPRQGDDRSRIESRAGTAPLRLQAQRRVTATNAGPEASWAAEPRSAANLTQSRPSTSSRSGRPGRELEVFNRRRTSNNPVDPL